MMNKETIKELLKFNNRQFAIFAVLFILAFFFGFFRISGCFLDENGIRVCRECGPEGIFNPLLRPISFVLANIIQGLIINGDISLCGAFFALIFYLPLDAIYLYILSGVIYCQYNKIRTKKQ